MKIRFGSEIIVEVDSLLRGNTINDKEYVSLAITPRAAAIKF